MTGEVLLQDLKSSDLVTNQILYAGYVFVDSLRMLIRRMMLGIVLLAVVFMPICSSVKNNQKEVLLEFEDGNYVDELLNHKYLFVIGAHHSG